MRYINSFNKFFEDFEVKDSDATDIKFAKEKMNSMNKYLTEYSAKKSMIDSIYKNEKDPKVREEKLKNILGKTESGPGEDRNPFLVKYCQIAKSISDVDSINKKIINDKLMLKDFEDSLGTVKDDTQKKLLQSQIADTKNKIADSNQKIKTINDDMKKMDGEIKKDITDLKKQIDEFNKKIQSEGKK
jgi:hypothetical protein